MTFECPRCGNKCEINEKKVEEKVLKKYKCLNCGKSWIEVYTFFSKTMFLQGDRIYADNLYKIDEIWTESS